MSLRRPSWLSWLVVAGLCAVYVGERIVPQLTIARIVFTAGGTLLVLGATIWQLIALRETHGEARRIQRLLLLAYIGCSIALIGFLLAGDGLSWLGIGLEGANAHRIDTILLVLSSVVLAAALLPVLAAQWASPARDRAHATGAIDSLRIRQLTAAALTVGLAAAFLFLTGYVAAKRDKTVDVSFFRTSSPGTTSRQIVESLREPLRVLLFFPPANEVADQTLGYFRALNGAAHNVEIEQHDRLAEPELASKHNVSEDGTIVLSVGDRTERVALSANMAEARGRLRKLDEDVQHALMRVAREARTIYLTAGHGELNDSLSDNPVSDGPPRTINALRSMFDLLNYRVLDLGIQGGLGRDVPADAAMVIALGPQRPFLDAELQALDRYLARGGAVLLALEPESAFELGALRDRLGVEYRKVALADDQEHLQQRGNVSDRRLVITDRFSSHESVSTLGKAGFGSGILLVGAGHLELTADSSPASFVIRSLQSTFADADHDFELDEGQEQRGAYNLVAAVERAPASSDNGSSSNGDAKPNPRGMRALVFADAEMFTDAVVTSLGLNAALAADAVRWLGHEEELAGTTSSEEDVPIVHTRSENVAWFYFTILGAPALVLALGLFAVRKRRRRASDVEATA